LVDPEDSACGSESNAVAAFPVLARGEIPSRVINFKFSRLPLSWSIKSSR